jgi:hypothetical protein
MYTIIPSEQMLDHLNIRCYKGFKLVRRWLPLDPKFNEFIDSHKWLRSFEEAHEFYDLLKSILPDLDTYRTKNYQRENNYNEFQDSCEYFFKEFEAFEAYTKHHPKGHEPKIETNFYIRPVLD